MPTEYYGSPALCYSHAVGWADLMLGLSIPVAKAVHSRRHRAVKQPSSQAHAHRQGDLCEQRITCAAEEMVHDATQSKLIWEIYRLCMHRKRKRYTRRTEINYRTRPEMDESTLKCLGMYV